MSLNEMIGRAFEAEADEKFMVKGVGYLFADKVKREYAEIDTPLGTVTGTVVIDFEGKPGLIGYDSLDRPRVFAYSKNSWKGSELSLKDSKSNLVVLRIGPKGFEIKSNTVEEKIEEKDVEEDIGMGKVPVTIKDTKDNQDIHPELIGKMGYIVKEYHSQQGLRYDVIVGEDSYNMDWRSVKKI